MRCPLQPCAFDFASATQLQRVRWKPDWNNGFEESDFWWMGAVLFVVARAKCYCCWWRNCGRRTRASAFTTRCSPSATSNSAACCDQVLCWKCALIDRRARLTVARTVGAWSNKICLSQLCLTSTGAIATTSRWLTVWKACGCLWQQHSVAARHYRCESG